MALAARLLFATCSISAFTPFGVRGQPLVRTRDVGFATVAFDNGKTFGAITLNETALLEKASGTLIANGLVSLFNDGRWSMQGLLSGTRFSEPIPLATRRTLGSWFEAMQGELSLATLSTAQHGFMPTLQFTGHSRMHATARNHGAYAGAGIARTFDGVGWRTTVLGDLGGWARVGRGTTIAVRSVPYQLQFGDLLGDHEGSVEWAHGRSIWGTSVGVRTGEAGKETVAWGAVTLSAPLFNDLFVTVSAGKYPVDLIQGLPGGSYLSVGFRLPEARWALRREIPPPPRPPVAPRLELPTSVPLSLVIGPSLDSLGIREIRAWAPGAKVVELMADFVDWLPVPLLRQPNGEWRGYYYVTDGAHRVNLRLDGVELRVPLNLASIRDDFVGDVGLIIVR